MLHLSDHSHLRNPLFTTKQCNWLEPLITREGKVIGTRFCAKDVWAEVRMQVPELDVNAITANIFSMLAGKGDQHGGGLAFKHASAGIYCPAHFMRMLAGTTRSVGPIR